MNEISRKLLDELRLDEISRIPKGQDSSAPTKHDRADSSMETAMRKSDATREAQVHALKAKAGVDNPWTKADDGEPQLPSDATPRTTGHTGESYTYGQKRGEMPATTAALEAARDNTTMPNTTDETKALHEALGPDAAILAQLDDEDDLAAVDPTLRGKPVTGDQPVSEAPQDDDEQPEIDPEDIVAQAAEGGGHTVSTGHEATTTDEGKENIPTAEPADKDPAVAAQHIMSKGKITAPPTVGQELLSRAQS